MSNKNNRNDPCTCGSGKKYKKCCGFQVLAAQQLKLGTRRFGLPSTAAALGGMKNNLFKKIQKEEPVRDGSDVKSTAKRIFRVRGVG